MKKLPPPPPIDASNEVHEEWERTFLKNMKEMVENMSEKDLKKFNKTLDKLDEQEES